MKAVGAGIQPSATATRVVLGLGLGPALAAVAVNPGGKSIRLWNPGRRQQLLDLGA